MEELMKAVKLSEGYKPTVYKDTLQIDTIGYGFAIKDLYLDEEVCDIILEQKLKKLIKSADKKFEFLKYMPQKGKDVVYEMCYQLGINGVSKFKKTLAYMQDKKYDKAAVEMLDSLWAKQTPNRAIKLSNIIKSLG
tara:strand:- start:1115 stop:1522 length:408 start_codon:yes stop_codon:yes gene_type:complete